MSETSVDMGMVSDTSTPTPAPQSPYERDVARAEAGRQEIQRTRDEAAARRRETAEHVGRPDAPKATQTEQPQETRPWNNKPSWCPPDIWKNGAFDAEAFGKHYGDNIAPKLAAHAEWEAGRSNLPATPDDYEVRTSPTFKPPVGVDYEINASDPRWNDFRTWAHSNGVSQEAFSAGLDLLAARETRELLHVNTARNAELGKLGPNGQARAETVATWLENTVGDDAAVLAHIIRHAPMASIVERLERIIVKMNGIGSSSRAHPQNGGIDGWDRMTHEQRRAAQDAQGGSGRSWP